MSVAVVGPDGKVVDIPALDAAAQQWGYRQATPEEISAAESTPVDDGTDYESPGQQAATVLEGLGGGLSMGVLPWAAQKLGITTPEATQARAEANPTEHMGSEILGNAVPFLIPGGAEVQGAKGVLAASDAASAVSTAANVTAAAKSIAPAVEEGTSLLSKLKTAASYTPPGLISKAGEGVRSLLGSGLPSSLASYAAEGAMFGGANLVEKHLLGDDSDLSAEHVLSELGSDAMFGTMLGGVGYGLSKLLPSQAALADSLNKKSVTWAARSILGGSAEDAERFFEQGANRNYQMQLVSDMQAKGIISPTALPSAMGLRGEALAKAGMEQANELTAAASAEMGVTPHTAKSLQDEVVPGILDSMKGDSQQSVSLFKQRLADKVREFGNEPLTYDQLWGYRQRLDDLCKAYKPSQFNTPDVNAVFSPLRQMRSHVADRLDAAMDAAGLKAQWLGAMRDTEVGLQAKSLAAIGVANMAKTANLGNSFSLAGIISGHPLTGMAAQYAKKLAGLYVPGVTAAGAGKLSELLADEGGLKAFYAHAEPRFQGEISIPKPVVKPVPTPFAAFKGPVDLEPSTVAPTMSAPTPTSVAPTMSAPTPTPVAPTMSAPTPTPAVPTMPGTVQPSATPELQVGPVPPPIAIPHGEPLIAPIREVEKTQPYAARLEAQTLQEARGIVKVAKKSGKSVAEYLKTQALTGEDAPSMAGESMARIIEGTSKDELLARYRKWAQQAASDPWGAAGDVLHAPLPKDIPVDPPVEPTEAQRIVQAAKTASEARLQRASDGLFNVRAPRKAAKPKKYFHGGDVTPETFHKAAENLRYLNDPAHCLDRMTDEFMKQTPVVRSEMPMLANSLHVGAVRMSQYLHSQLPQPPQEQYLLDGPFEPTESELADFNKHKDIADNGPAAMLEHLRDNTLTQEHIQASQAMYPKMHAQAVDNVIQELANHVADHGEVPPEMRGDLGMLLGKDLDGTYAPDRILATQTLFTNGGPQQQSQMLGNTRQRANPRGPRNVKLGIADRTQTASEGVTDRMNGSS